MHAKSEMIPDMICLVYELAQNLAISRNIPTQHKAVFDLSSGEGVVILNEYDDSEVHNISKRVCKIDSVEPLPGHIHSALLSADRRLRLGGTINNNRMNRDEVEAMIFVDDFYSNYPLW